MGDGLIIIREYIGCHSYYHRLIYDLTPEESMQDTKAAKDILEELGFTRNSNTFPIRHDRYGVPDAPPRFKYKIPGHNLTEYHISTSIFLGKKIPVAGGGCFRLFPY